MQALSGLIGLHCVRRVENHHNLWPPYWTPSVLRIVNSVCIFEESRTPYSLFDLKTFSYIVTAYIGFHLEQTDYAFFFVYFKSLSETILWCYSLLYEFVEFLRTMTYHHETNKSGPIEIFD